MSPRRFFVPAAALLAASLVSPSAIAAPVDDDVALLRARPTGMDEDEWRKQRREVAADLGEKGSPKAVDALIEIVETERYDAVLSISIESLGKLGDPRALPALQKVYADRSIDTFVRQQAGKAIKALGGTPRDDARLTGGVAAGPAGSEGGGLVGGPQLGTMGEASVSGDEGELEAASKPLPDSVVARERDVAIILGALDLAGNLPLGNQPGDRERGNPILADFGLGVAAAYVDERRGWGFSARGVLDAALKNGDLTATPDPSGNDDGNTMFIGQGLAGTGSVHAYFGQTDVHAFGSLSLSQRLVHARVADLGASGGVDESTLSDTRFGMDVIPAAGLGYGRFLNAGSDVLVDAVVSALEAENILTRPLDANARRQIRDALYRSAGERSSYPRVASVLAVLTRGGYLARRPGPRLTHRLRSIVEDPSYIERNKGLRARVGFLYDVAIAQGDRFQREGDAVGAPFLTFEGGFVLDRERQLSADVRFWYDALGSLKGFTSDVGARYTRFIHGKYDDYYGQWFAAVRGGVSARSYLSDVDADGDPDQNDTNLGYRAMASAGYTYAFRRGTALSVSANAGADSGRAIFGLSLGFRLGLARASVYRSASEVPTGRGKKKPKREAGPAPAAK